MRILALPSFENLISLYAPRVNEGVETSLVALAAAQRRDAVDWYIFLREVVRAQEGMLFFLSFELATEEHVMWY